MSVKYVWRRNLRKVLFYIAGFFIAAFILFILLESILALAQFVTKNSVFANLNDEVQLSQSAPNCVRISIFGESFAFGWGAEFNFKDVLSYELKKTFPDKQFQIVNYAKCGDPFHRHQAEILKSVIDKYDIFLIYAGHNEARNYFDDVGYFRTEKYKKIKMLSPPIIKKDGNVSSELWRFLRSKSRIYALAKYIKKRLTKIEFNIYRMVKLEEFEKYRLLPPEEVERMNNNLKKDLQEIAFLAKKHGKVVIISSVPSNEGYKPFLSVHRTDITGAELEKFGEEYRQGMSYYNVGDFSKAIDRFQKAYLIDDQVAILDYMIGQSYIKTGDLHNGRKFLRASVDNDGAFLRSRSSFHIIEREIAENNINILYTDSVAAFHKLLDNGVTYEDLFIDFQHPSSMGHVVIAHEFLQKIIDVQPFRGNAKSTFSEDIDVNELKKSVTFFKKELGVTKEKEAFNALEILKWHIGMSLLAAYPEDYLNVAGRKLVEYYEKSRKTNKDVALNLIYKAVILARRGNLKTAIECANMAVAISQKVVVDELYYGLPTGPMVLEVLNDDGIKFVNNRFEINKISGVKP